ncbi:MAG: leucine-rich repeat domain-containing protein, partial [Eubacteriales bacterium]|nr:leucine-rich repeat domain-containing protein [Eubacteriales bacterium]
MNVRDYVEEDGKAYLVMEYLSGEDLSTKIKREGPVSFAQAWNMMLPLIKTVQRMHEEGLIHRDISPDNVRILPNGNLKLLDFGSSLDLGQELDRTVTMAVKPGYAPYEQYMSKEMQGSWTDVYAICATLYKCVTGITPPDSLQRAFKDDMATPTEKGAAITPEEEAVLLRGMAIKPDERIRTIQELEESLSTQSASVGRPQETRREAPVRNREEARREAPVKNREEVRREAPVKNREEARREASGRSREEVQREARQEAPVKKPGKRRADMDTASNAGKGMKRPKQKKKSKVKAPLIALGALLLVVIAAIAGKNLPGSGSSGTSTTCSFNRETVTPSKIKGIGKNITNVQFWHCDVSEETLEKLAQNENVEKILIEESTGFTSLSTLASMKNLKELQFDNIALTDPAPTDTTAVFGADFPNLEFLKVSVVCQEDDGAFLRHFPKLKTLYLEAEGLTSLEFLEKMPVLERLVIKKMNLSNGVSESISQCKNLKSLKVNDSGLDSLSFAAPLDQLAELVAENCAVSDLTPLENHEKLRQLELPNNQISDITPLKTCTQLENLVLSDNQVTSVEALATTSMRMVYLNNNQVEDLSPLNAISTLSTVELNNNKLQSLSGLGNSGESLTWLSVKGNEISDISELASCNRMYSLWLSDNQITDLSACEKMLELKVLYADHNQISDVSGLMNSTELKDISVSDNQITDISFLENNFDKLELLNISNNQVTSAKALAGSSNLKVFIADNNKLTSLEGLEGKESLYAVLVSHNEIQSLEPLSENTAKLLYVDFGYNQISDISVLSALSGKAVEVLLDNNRISDISMLPPQRRYAYLTLYGNPLQDISVIGKFENINFLYDTLYIPYLENGDMTPLAESKYGKSSELRIIDCPADSQAKMLKMLKDAQSIANPRFITVEEADAEVKEHRESLLREVLGEDEETETSEDA